MICYHFCDKEFLKKLKKEKEIYPKPNCQNSNALNRVNAYNYLFENLSVDSLFFAWQDKDNKNSSIEYVSDSDYLLLTLDVPEDVYILTNYYNWCDIIYCLESGNISDAEEIVREEFGCDKGFDFIFNQIYNLEDGLKIVQVLLKYMNYDWIKNIEFVKDKII